MAEPKNKPAGKKAPAKPKGKPPAPKKPAGSSAKGKPKLKVDPKGAVSPDDAAAKKKPRRIEVPKAPQGKIGILLWSAFTHDGEVDDKGVRVPHWNSQPVKENVVRRATVAVGQSRVSKPTDDNGTTTLDLTGLPDGSYDLSFVPAADEIGTVAAGPDLTPATSTKNPPLRGDYGAGEPKYAERMYRRFTLRVIWRNGAMSGTPTYVGTSDHVHVMRLTPNGLEIDWKPDWVRARNLRPRPADKPVSVIVLHRTESATIGSAFSTFMKAPDANGSYANAHYLVDTDGFVVKMAADGDEAAHAGRGAQWEGNSPVNAFSVGIECVNEKGDFPKAQMRGLASLIGALKTRHRVAKQRIVGHCEVSPLRKNKAGDVHADRQECPGEHFDWPYLEKLGLASAPLPKDSPNPAIKNMLPRFFRDQATADEALQQSDTDKDHRYGGKRKPRPVYGDTIRTMQWLLQDVGYERALPPPKGKVQDTRVVPERGEYDAATALVVARLQRRYFAKRGESYSRQNIDRGTARMIARVILGRLGR